MNLRKKILPLAVGVAMATALSASAQAGVLAQSVLNITNFTIQNADGTTVSTSQFDQFVFQDSSQITATLTGFGTATNTVNSGSFGTLDNPQQCVGNCIFGQNDYSLRLVPTTDLARGDSLLQGSPITNTAGVPTPADAHTVAEAQLTSGTGSGNVTSNLGLTATISFSFTNDQTVTFDFDSLSHLIASIGLTDALGSTARASEQWVIDIANSAGTTVFSWSPDGVVGTGITGGTESADECNLQSVRNAQIPGQTSVFDCSGSHTATTGLLLASETYTLGLRHVSIADATRIVTVPEPATLALAGLGLLGVGLSRRKRQ